MNAVVQSSHTGTVELLGERAPDRVIVKFFFTNPKHIPPGIPEKGQDPNWLRDAANATWASLHGLANESQVGRVRPGRVDTGQHILDNLPDVQLGLLRRGLNKSDYVLTDVHWFRAKAKKPGGQAKFVVCLTFCDIIVLANTEAGSQRYKELMKQFTQEFPRPLTEALRALAKTTWQFCHVWLNPDGTSTINLVGRRWDDQNQCYLPPRHALVVRERTLRAIPVEVEVPEDQE